MGRHGTAGKSGRERSDSSPLSSLLTRPWAGGPSRDGATNHVRHMVKDKTTQGPDKTCLVSQSSKIAREEQVGGVCALSQAELANKPTEVDAVW